MHLIILGATGSLGGHVLRQALGSGHDVSVLVRDPSRLPADARERVTVHTGDLNVDLPSDVVSGHDVLINCAGHVAEGERFVSLVDRVVATVEFPARGRATRLLVPGRSRIARYRCFGPPRRRAAKGEVDLLAASRQLRAPRGARASTGDCCARDRWSIFRPSGWKDYVFRSTDCRSRCPRSSVRCPGRLFCRYSPL